MEDDNDFIMRQIKSFANGVGFLLGKNKAKSEVIFEQQQNQKGKIYTDIDELLLHHKYDAAINYVYKQKFTLDKDSYYRLGQWLLKKLKTDPMVDSKLLNSFADTMKKYQSPIS